MMSLQCCQDQRTAGTWRGAALHRLPCLYAMWPPTRVLIVMDSRLPCPTDWHLISDGHGRCVCLPVLASGAAAGGAVVAVAGDSAAAAKKAPTKSRLLRTMRFCETSCRKHARSPSLSRSSPSRRSRSRSRCSGLHKRLSLLYCPTHCPTPGSIARVAAGQQRQHRG